MKSYELTYVEKTIYTFYIDANSPEEAEKYFHDNAHRLDFTDGDVYDSYVASVKEEEE